MDEPIELPPLPPFGIAPIADEQTVRDYARAAVLADRERRKKPDRAVYRRGVMLAERPNFGVVLCWTDDGRAWIESEENRELARLLRNGNGVSLLRLCADAADALDGGNA